MATTTSRDEERLAEMGYKQELDRSWSGFQNFAISFTIISVLAGCFTTYYQAWNNGGPVAISWGWPIISAFILIIAFCMSELASSYPTAGGIYWWSAKLGGPGWGWINGWVELLGRDALLPPGRSLPRPLQPARADRLPRLGRLLRRPVPRGGPRPLRRQHPRAELRRQRPRPARDLRPLRDPADAARDPQHPRQPPRRPPQRRVGLLARRRPRGDRRDPDLRAVQARELPRRLHPDAEQLRLRPQHVLVVRAAARLPADAVHDHRVRRLRAHLRGDARRLDVRREGHLAVGLLLGDRRLHRAAGHHLHGEGHEGRQRGRRHGLRGLRERDGHVMGEDHPDHLRRGAVLLRHE